MPSAKRFWIVVLLGGLLLAEWSSVGPQQTSQPTVATTGEVTILETRNSTSKMPSCSIDQSDYEVATSEKPNVLNETTVKRVTVEYEKRYQRARHEAIYNLTHYQSSIARCELEKTDDGFEVTVKIRVEFQTSDGTDASGGYPHTYLVSDGEVVRDGETIICW